MSRNSLADEFSGVLKQSQGCPHWLDELLQDSFLGIYGDEVDHRKRETSKNIEMQHLSAEKIHGLHAVRAFIDLRDAHVAHMLFLAIGADEAVPAQNLHPEIGGLAAAVGKEGLHHRR